MLKLDLEKWFSKKEFLDNYIKKKDVVNVKNLNNPVITKKTFNPDEYS